MDTLQIPPVELEKIARTLAVMLRQPEKNAALPEKDDDIPGYLRGADRAAHYLGISRGALINWVRDCDPDGLLTPRIINGRTYYSIARLDRFMDPSRNVPGDIAAFMGV